MISNVLIWKLTHGRASVSQPTKTYRSVWTLDPKEKPVLIGDSGGWQERERQRQRQTDRKRQTNRNGDRKSQGT